MTEKEKIEGNWLITSFYGAAYNHVQEYYLLKEFSFMGRIDEMKFHYSWDWQIPVWSKIALAVKTLLAEKKYSHLDIQHIYLDRCDRYEQAVFQNKPEDGQKIIVELINWYNNQKEEIKKQ